MMGQAVFFFICCTTVLVSSQEVLSSTKTKSASIELCGPETDIELTKNGETSSKLVTLSPQEHNSFCKLRVTAPKTHVINLQFIEGGGDELFNNTEKHPPCVMSIFLPENRRIPVWKGDLCSKTALTEPELLTSDFKIMWDPPANPAFTKGRKFVITAVGRGPVCKEPGQHTCIRIGWDPMLCVSEDLMCDGISNCPKTATTSDEDPKICTQAFFSSSSLEQLAVEILRKWKPSSLANSKRLYEKREHSSSPTPKRPFYLKNWKDVEKTETSSSTTKKPPMVENKAKATDSISQVLSKYGPWGYLMLGMLICGTVLMFCGLWECCFRKPKTDVEAPISAQQPTTVLIINNRQEEVANPPNYDELDQPPSYTTLFPHFKTQTSCSSSNNDNNSASESAQEQTRIDISIPNQQISAEET